MKPLLFILGGLILTGCASAHMEQSSQSLGEQHEYEPATASALVFDAPVSAPYPLPGLDREAREPGVFVGYQDSTVESYTIYMQDNQSNDPQLDQYNRTSSTVKVGSRYR